MSFKQQRGTVTLGGGHSLIVGNVINLNSLATKLKDEREEVIKAQIAKFGLFNLATPDTTTFYQNVKAEDLKPEEADFIRPLFRGLSETIVRKHYDPIDFGHEKGVLKDSMGMMIGQTVYSNHEAFQGNEKGVVNEVMWDTGYNHEGILVPAGFNMEFLIDGKVHVKLARELQAPRPIVHSNSVTVQFGWKQSHPKMDLAEFRSKVGTFDDKGELVRRIVNEIYGYHETSLVAHGADPFAQILDKSGKIINPKYAHARDSFCEERKVSPFFAFDWKDSLSEKAIPNDPNISEHQDLNDKEKPNMKGFKGLILLVAALAGIKLGEDQTSLSDEDFSTKFDLEKFNADLAALKLDNVVISNLQGQITTLTSEKETLEDDKTKLEAEKTTLEKFKTDNEPKLKLIDKAEEFKAAELAEVLRLHALLKEDDDLKPTLEAADIKTLSSFKKTYTKQLEKKFPSSCSECGSKNITKASAEVDDDDDDNQDKNKPKSLSQVRDKFIQQNSGKGYSAILGRGDN